MKKIRMIKIGLFVLVSFFCFCGVTYTDNFEIKLGSGDAFEVQDSSGTSLMDVLSSGNVGIGTTSPGALLHVAEFGNGSQYRKPQIRVNNWADMSSNSNVGYAMFANNAYTFGWSGSGDTFYYSNDHPNIGASGVIFGSAPGNEIKFFNSTTPGTANQLFTPNYLMTINSSGNVGIGITTPTTRLEVDVPGSGANDITYPLQIMNSGYSDSSSGAAIVLGSQSGGNDQYGKGAIIFERTGAYGVGKLHFALDNVTSSATSPPDYADAKLTINYNGNVGIGMMSPNYPLEMGSGAHVTSGGAWTNASSREYKNNIRNLTFEEAKTALEELTPTRYYYNVDNEDEYLGFIAEDVPDLVATKDRKGLSPMDIVAVLTKVVQQQQSEIEELKALFNNGQ